MLIALIVSTDLVASLSRYPWQDHEMSLNSIHPGGQSEGCSGQDRLISNHESIQLLW